MKYNIEFKKQGQDGSYVLIPVIEDIKINEAYGDQIGLSADDGYMWVDEYLDLDDEDVIEFIDNYFEKPTAVKGFLRRIL